MKKFKKGNFLILNLIHKFINFLNKNLKDNKKFLEGIVEVDETYIGGKPRANEHKKRKKIA